MESEGKLHKINDEFSYIMLPSYEGGYYCRVWGVFGEVNMVYLRYPILE